MLELLTWLTKLERAELTLLALTAPFYFTSNDWQSSNAVKRLYDYTCRWPQAARLLARTARQAARLLVFTTVEQIVVQSWW